MTHDLRGLMITNVRLATQRELDNRLGWDRTCIAIDLDNGLTLYASCDEEGNGPGDIFAYDSEGYPVSFLYDHGEWW